MYYFFPQKKSAILHEEEFMLNGSQLLCVDSWKPLGMNFYFDDTLEKKL